MSALDWAIVLVLNIGVVGHGLYLARGTTSSGDWFLGRRLLPWSTVLLAASACLVFVVFW